MLVSICYKSINNSVSIFHSQFALDMFFFFKQFQSHCFYKAFSYTSFFFSCPGGSFPRGTYVDNKSSEKQFSLGEISRGILSGSNYPRGNYPGGNFWGTIFQEAIVWGAIIWEAVFLGGNCLDIALSVFLLLLYFVCHFLRKNVILY